MLILCNMKLLSVLLLSISLLVHYTAAFIDPYSIAAGASALVTEYGFIELAGMTSKYVTGVLKDLLYSGKCDSGQFKPNMTNFKNDLNKLLYGQHIAHNVVYKAVKSHLRDTNPRKPLVMSFHGWTGNGKSHVSRLITKNVYSKADNSPFVHVLNAELYFKHKHQLPLYKDQLQSWIKGNVSRCSRSIFVFEEIDHMPEGLIDAIKPFLGTEPSVDKVDYRQSMFIFLSNTGGNDIVTKCLEVWKEGKQRSSITLSDMQEILELNAYNTNGGLKLSGVIDHNVIDHFIPFLPLERNHVRLCIQDEIRRNYPRSGMDVHKATIDQILQELQWFPEGTELYSKSGCKKVSHKVSLIVDD